MKLDKETVKAVLEELRQFAGYLYFDPSSREKFNNTKRVVDGKEYSITILDDGNYKVSCGEDYYVYLPFARTAPLKNGLDNVSFQLARGEGVGNTDEFDNAAIFLLSAFQRAIAYIWFARFAPETIEELSNVLAKDE